MPKYKEQVLFYIKSRDPWEFYINYLSRYYTVNVRCSDCMPDDLALYIKGGHIAELELSDPVIIWTDKPGNYELPGESTIKHEFIVEKQEDYYD